MKQLLNLESQTLDEYVLAFENRQAESGQADLRDFLPEKSHPQYLTVLRELIRVDLELGWGRGKPRPLQEYRSEFPELFKDPTSLQEIAFEEYRQRLLAGETPSASDYEQQYGIQAAHWEPPATVVRPIEGISRFDHRRTNMRMENAAQAYQEFCDRDEVAGEQELEEWCQSVGGQEAELFRELHKTQPREARRLAESLTLMPEVGETFAGFELVDELGHGAFGRVFLARQPMLANRHVALKVAPEVWKETQKLAQLQHTNIVPVHSVHKTRNLQAVCMPFLGTQTLSDLLRRLTQAKRPPASADDLFASWSEATVVGKLGGAAPAAADAKPKEAAPTALDKLRGLSFVDTMLSLGVGMADGLAYAHERGILHRDLKPANVLLTDDGQPLLLDFNLSEDTKTRDLAAAALVGGTLPYMAPEQMRAFRGERESLDARTDIYSLGLILYELLTLDMPFPTRKDVLAKVPLNERLELMLAERSKTPLPARARNPKIPWSVNAILAKCLDPDQDRRYATARQLQEDLQRHLDDLPLKHTPEPSLRERAVKFIRRNPRLPGTVLAAAVPLLLIIAVLFGWRAIELDRTTTAAHTLTMFHKDTQEAKFKLNTGIDDPDDQQESIARCQAALGHYGVLENPSWQEQHLVRYLPEAEQVRLKKEIAEALLDLAKAVSWASKGKPQSQREQDLRHALTLNTQAEQLWAEADEVPAYLWKQREDLLIDLGDKDGAAGLRKKVGTPSLKTSQDYYLIAREEQYRGQFDKALPIARKATDLDPRNFWAWFCLGVQNDKKGADDDAYYCYSICIALDGELPYPYFQRGLTLLRQKKYSSALADFNKVIQLKEDFAEAYFNRALAYQNLRKDREAVIDLTYFLEKKPGATRAYFLRAVSHKRLGDTAAEQRDLEQGLARQPTDEKSWVARGYHRLKGNDIPGALQDFEQALTLNPYSRPALINKAHILSERLKKTQEGLALLEKILKVYPDHTPSRVERGILHARLGNVENAREDAEQAMKALAYQPSAEVRYKIGCIHALLSKDRPENRPLAFRLLTDALKGGYGAQFLATDTDLDALRSFPEFQKLQDSAKQKKTKI